MPAFATRIPSCNPVPAVKKQTLAILFGGAAVAAAFAIHFLGSGPQAPSAGGQPAAKPPPLVSVAVARQLDLPIKLVAQGHLVSLNQVDIRPQLNGTVRSVHFQEGSDVSAGQLLFTLDASDATSQLEHAKAQAAQMKAQLEEAQRDLKRSRQLAQDNFISASVVDSAAGKVSSLQGQVDAALADVQGAQTALARTRIVAPIGGVTGQLSVHPGSLAQQSAAAPLVSIVQMDPIGADFTLPEADLAHVLAARAAGSLSVSLDDPGGQPVAGKLVFINNTVNTDTATINLKAAFANPRKLMWPGVFVKVTVDAGVDRAAIVLPPQAVVDGPQGRFVYLLAGDDTVSVVPVTLLRLQDRLAVVRGLKGGERVVAEGNQSLRAGMRVRVGPSPTGQSATPPSPAASQAQPGA